MNTNYSKIALLLALTAVGGNKVGAKIEAREMQLQTGQESIHPERRLKRVNMFEAINKQMLAPKAVGSLSESLSRMFTPIRSLSGVSMGSNALVGMVEGDKLADGDKSLTDLGQKIFGMKDDDGKFLEILKDQAEKKEIQNDVKKFFKSLDKDIKALNAACTGGSASILALEGLEGPTASTVDGINDFVRNIGTKTLKELCKSHAKLFGDHEHIAYRTLESDGIVKILSEKYAALNEQINALSANSSLTATSSNGSSKVQIKDALVSLSTSIQDWVAYFSSALLNKPLIPTQELQKIIKAAKRVKAFSEFASKIRVHNEKGLTEILESVSAIDVEKKEERARSKLTTNLRAGIPVKEGEKDPEGITEQNNLIATYMKDAFGENDEVHNPAKCKFEYRVGEEFFAAKKGEVNEVEAQYAFGTEAKLQNYELKKDEKGFSEETKVIDESIKAFFKPFHDLQNALKVVERKKFTQNKFDRYDVIQKLAQGGSDSTSLDTPNWNFNDRSSTNFYGIIDWFGNVTENMKKLRTDKKPFTGDWGQTLTNCFNFVNKYVQDKTSGIVGNSMIDTGGSTIVSGMTKNQVTDFENKLKAAYDEAMKEWTGGGVTLNQTTAIKTLKNVTDIKDWFTSNPTKGSLNIADIQNNPAILQQLKALDSTAANQYYKKMYDLLGNVQGGVAPSNADVEALKTLFRDGVGDQLAHGAGSNSYGNDNNDQNKYLSSKHNSYKVKDSEDGSGSEENDGDKVTIEDLELDFLDSATGKLVKGTKEDMEELIEPFKTFLKGELDSFKSEKKKNKQKITPKNTLDKAKEIVEVLVAKFEDNYEPKDGDDD
ncbi:MAG: hypothetical protein FJX00_01235, partial [Alphaproteobacteria bacterium]|nr:hypothetical protein [Alphaproteobacteria bacterium]